MQVKKQKIKFTMQKLCDKIILIRRKEKGKWDFLMKIFC